MHEFGFSAAVSSRSEETLIFGAVGTHVFVGTHTLRGLGLLSTYFLH